MYTFGIIVYDKSIFLFLLFIFFFRPPQDGIESLNKDQLWSAIEVNIFFEVNLKHNRNHDRSRGL